MEKNIQDEISFYYLKEIQFITIPLHDNILDKIKVELNSRKFTYLVGI